jgi:hypothetical protein
MNANLDKIAQDLYGKIQTRFSNIKIGDESGKVLERKQDIPNARFFEFEYKENGESLGTVSITLDEDDGIIVEISGDLADSKHPGAFKFFRSFRQFAKDRLLNFDLQNIGKDSLDKRDYTFRAKPKEEPMNPIMENKMYGTTRMSYQDLGEARLVVKHSQPVNLDLAAGRTMHIESIYVENADGERFKYPYKHLNGARALAEHIKAGGTPYDAIGKHISSLSEELAQLRKFKGYVGRNEALSEAVGGLTDVVSERIEQIKKEVSSLQRPSYYQAFAESFTARDEEMIPEEILNDFIDRLTIRTFNEDLKQSFPYIFRLIDESDIPVRELSAEDILDEGGITLGADGQVDPNGFTPEKQMALDQMVQQQQNAKAGDKDLGDGFTLVQIDMFGGVQGVLDTQTNTYIIPNRRANGSAIIRSPGRYILVKDGHTETTMNVGPSTAAALQKAGLGGQQESFDPELAFESFINNISESDEDDFGQGILDTNPTVKQNAIKKLNDFFKADVSPGIGGFNLEELTKLIPIPEFKDKIDELVSLTKDKSDKDVSTTIEMILTDIAQNNSDLAEIMQNGLIDFNGEGGEVGGEEEPPATDASATPPAPTPEAPPAPDASATPPAPAPEAGAEAVPPGPEATPTPPPVAEEILRLRKLSGLNEGMNGANVNNQPTPGNPVPSQHGEIVKKDLPSMDMNPGAGSKPANPNMSKMKAKFIKARECGAELHHELDFGHKTMTLHDAIRECGLTPMECGFGDQEAADEHQSGVHQMLASVAGFWNRENKNFTIGGTRAKTKIIKGFKDGEFPNASQEDLDQVLHIIDKMDPSHGDHELGRIKHLAGTHDHAVDENSEEEDDFSTMMSQFLDKHQGVNPDEMLDKFLANHPDAKVTRSNTSSGSINGQPASYDDAVNKIKGMKFKMGDQEFDPSNPQAMHGQIGNMMKGIMGKAQGQMPNQNIQMPGGGAQMNPQEFMKNIMGKINFGN